MIPLLCENVSYSRIKSVILFRKDQEKRGKDWTKDGKPPFKVDKYGNVEQRKPSTKVFDKTQEWVEQERGKGAGRSKLSDEEIAL